MAALMQFCWYKTLKKKTVPGNSQFTQRCDEHGASNRGAAGKTVDATQVYGRLLLI